MAQSLKLMTRCGCSKFISINDDADLPREIRVPLTTGNPIAVLLDSDEPFLFMKDEKPKERIFELYSHNKGDYPRYMEKEINDKKNH